MFPSKIKSECEEWREAVVRFATLLSPFRHFDGDCHSQMSRCHGRSSARCFVLDDLISDGSGFWSTLGVQQLLQTIDICQTRDGSHDEILDVDVSSSKDTGDFYFLAASKSGQSEPLSLCSIFSSARDLAFLIPILYIVFTHSAQ